MKMKKGTSGSVWVYIGGDLGSEADIYYLPDRTPTHGG
jgi:hypothetical protein